MKQNAKGAKTMELKVFRDTVSVSQQLCDLTLEHPVETEILIPDYQPEIFKIVKSFVSPVILQKQVLGGKLTLEGYLRVSVLYQGGSDQSLCQVEQKLPFSRSVELKTGECSGCRVSVHGESEYLNTRAVNQRRIDVKGAYAFAVAAFGQNEQEIVTSLSGAGVQQKLVPVDFTRVVASIEKPFTVEDSFAFPARPEAVLDAVCTGSIAEIKLISGKAVVKGTLCAAVTYRSAPGYALERVQKELAFNQIVDIESLTEDCSCHAEILPQGCTLVEGGEQDGGASISVSCALSLLVLRQNLVYAVGDAFSTQYEAKVETKPLLAEHLVDDFHYTITAAGEGALPDENSAIIDCLATPLPLSAVDEGGELCLRGRVMAHLICCNSLGEIECYDKPCEVVLPKKYPAGEGTLTVDVTSLLESARAQKTTSGASCEVTLTVSGTVMERRRLTVLDAISCDEPLAPPTDGVALRVYYGRAGEELFAIARHYHADPAEIARQSGVEGETLQEEMRLLIPAAE